MKKEGMLSANRLRDLHYDFAIGKACVFDSVMGEYAVVLLAKH
jgi:hypothetical protein